MNNKDFPADELLKNLYFGGKKQSSKGSENTEKNPVTEPNKPEKTNASVDTKDTTEELLEDDKQKELRDVRQSFLWTQSLTNDMNILVTMLYRNKRKSLNDLVVKVLEDFIAQEENQELINKYKEFFGE